jgi:ATP-dependent Clp protease ATP-binding subunit ClpC
MTVDNQDINFTPRSQKLLQFCKKIAQDLNYTDVGIPHLFAAFFELKKSRCIEILVEAGLDLNEFKRHLYETVLVLQPEKTEPNVFKLSSELKQVLSSATNLANDLSHSWVSAEHVFLAIFKDIELIPDEILVFLGVDINFVTTKVLNYLCDSEKNDSISSTMTQGGIHDLISSAGNNQQFSLLDKIATNMTQRALDNKLDPVYGREEEIRKLEDILNRRKKNNAIIIGESGVGKTAVVEALVQNIVSNKSSFFLNNKVVYELNLSSMIAGTKYRGEFEARIKQVIEEAKDDSVILFIDEIHTLIGAGDAEGGLDAANILKPALSNGEITVIGATTFKEYRQKFSKDKSLQRRFQPLIINEPSKKSTLEILSRKKGIYEEYHAVAISDEILNDIVEYADRYMLDSQFPDKAIDLMDLACSHLKVKKIVKPKKISDLENSLVKSFALEGNSFSAMNDDQTTIFEVLKKSVVSWQNKISANKHKLTRNHLFEVLSTKTNIPVDEFLKSETQKYLLLESKLKRLIVGQEKPVETISKCLMRHKSGLRDGNRPIGSFLFLGTTGVGKTFLAKILASTFFGSKESFVHLDMSEFSEESSVTKLTGSNPGYIGHENGGLLVEKVCKNPHSVVLFDEIEKAHPKVHQMLLQILDEGRLTDAHGRVGYFHNAIVIVTGNMGSAQLSKTQSLGFGSCNLEESNVDDAFKEVKKILPLELINRFDDVLFFNKLSDDNLKSIINYELRNLKESAAQNGLSLSFSRNLSNFIFKKVNDKEFGARSIKRIIQKEVSDAISREIVTNTEKTQFTVKYDKNSNKICVDF